MDVVTDGVGDFKVATGDGDLHAVFLTEWTVGQGIGIARLVSC